MPVLVLGAGCRCWCWWPGAGAGAGAGAGCWVPVLALVLSWLRMWWRQVAAPGAGAGAGAVSWLCAWWRQVAGAGAAAVSWLCTWWRHGAGAGELAVCTQHHTVLSLERSLSISAVGYLPSSGSVLADSCVKGCTVCAHTFVRIMLYAQRQALNRPLFQHVSACYTHNSRAGYCLALGE